MDFNFQTYYSSSINKDPANGTFEPYSYGYMLSDNYYATVSNDYVFAWINWDSVSSYSISTDTYVLINSEVYDYSFTASYVEYGGTSAFDSHNFTDYGCDVILVNLEIPALSFNQCYLFANNQIYSDVHWESYYVSDFSEITTTTSISIYHSNSTLCQIY